MTVFRGMGYMRQFLLVSLAKLYNFLAKTGWTYCHAQPTLTTFASSNQQTLTPQMTSSAHWLRIPAYKSVDFCQHSSGWVQINAAVEFGSRRVQHCHCHLHTLGVISQLDSVRKLYVTSDNWWSCSYDPIDLLIRPVVETQRNVRNIYKKITNLKYCQEDSKKLSTVLCLSFLPLCVHAPVYVIDHNLYEINAWY